MPTPIATMLLDRIQNQEGSFVSGEKNIISFDETKLPSMQFVEDDWSVSGTQQWGSQELGLLQHGIDWDVALGLSEVDPWVCMAGIAEILMHGDETRAKWIAQKILELNPTHERTYQHYFGEEITTALLVPQE